MAEMEIFECPSSELKAGDVIRCPGMEDEAWNTGIVKSVHEDEVVIFRPHGHAEKRADGSITCYTGIEEYTFPRDDEVEIFVFERKE